MTMAGTVVTCRWDGETVAAITAAAGEKGRSPWIRDAALRRLADDASDPLEQLKMLTPLIEQALTGCDREQREEIRPYLRRLGEAFNRGAK